VEDYATVTKEVGVNTFGEWLHEQRSLRRLTREELAKRIGCSVSALRKIEYGERRPSAQIAELMANCLDVPPEERSTFVRVARGELGADRLSREREPVTTPNVSSGKSNLPIYPTPLIGRQREVEQLCQLVRDRQCRLLTLVGPGGIGKSRLAVEAASSIQAVFANGVYFVPLASVSSIDAVISTIANAIHFSFYGPGDPELQLLSYMRDKQVLLIMDNAEHLLVKGAHEETVLEVLIEILQQAAQVKLLVTSRECLGLQDEWIFEVQGLSVPESIDAEESGQNTSVELFLQRARRAHVGFSAGVNDYPAIVHICQLVEGNPLGIELAAAWVRTLSCDEIGQEIEHGLDFLSVSTRDIPVRHRSMRAVFEQSWKLLTAEEQGVLLRLSVFQGGMQRGAAEAITGATLSLLSTLQAKSFLRRTPTGRYDLHELVRQYIADRLAQASEEEGEARDRHSAYYTEVVACLEGELKGAGQLQALAVLDAEVNNIRAGWRWAVRRGQTGAVRKPIRALWYFYDLRGWFQEAEATLGWAADQLEGSLIARGKSEPIVDRLSAYARAMQGWFYLRRGQLDQSQALLQSSLASLRVFGPSQELADVLYYLGGVVWLTGDFPRARACYLEELAAAEQAGDQWDIGRATSCLAIVAQTVGEYEEAEERWQTALAINRKLGDPRLGAFILHFYGILKHVLGAHREAQAYLQESLELSSASGDRLYYGMALSQLGEVTHALGDDAEAVRLLNESVTLLRELGEHYSLLHALIGLGAATLALGDYAASRTAYDEALRLAWERQSLPEVLEAATGMARWSARQGTPEQALVSVFFVLNHPAATEQTKEAACQLRAKLEAQLTPTQIEAFQAHAGEKTLKALVGDLLR
jgi:predicted ATPase/transcriptional regulator with XRE-family HTH domain/Tfp pilus assembly protein PilF